jgi:hypothetical protein
MGKYEKIEKMIQGVVSGLWKNEIKFRSRATSLLYFQRWTFDVRVCFITGVFRAREVIAADFRNWIVHHLLSILIC